MGSERRQPSWVVYAAFMAAGAIVGWLLISPIMGALAARVAALLGLAPGYVAAKAVLDRAAGAPAARTASAGRSAPLLAGAAIAVVAALYLLVWDAMTNEPACDVDTFGCLGSALAMLVLGGPVAAALVYVGFRVAGARYPLLGLTAIVLVVLVLPRIVVELDWPTWVWPPLLGAVAAAYTAGSRRAHG